MKNIIQFLQYGEGDEDLWNLYQTIIPLGVMVIAKEVDTTDLIFKLGVGDKKYNELPEFMRFSLFEELYKINRFKNLTASDIGHLLFINTNKEVERSDILKTDLEAFMEAISLLTLKTAVTRPIITGQKDIRYGDSMTLYAKSLSAYRYSGIKVDRYVWQLPDESITEGDDITYAIPNDFGLVGTTTMFKCKAIDVLDNESDWEEFEVNIESYSNPLVVSATLV